MHSSSHTTDEAETIEPRTIKRRIRKPWSYVETFGSKEDAMEALKNERCWSMLYKNTSSAGTRVTYRCNLVKLQGKQCDAGVYLLYDSRSSKVHWFRSETEHTHDSLKNAKHLISSQFTSAEEAAIIKMYEIGVRPKGIAISMVRKGFREPSNKALISFLQKLRNLKKKKKKHANLTEFHSVASSSRDLSTSTRSKQPKQEFISKLSNADRYSDFEAILTKKNIFSASPSIGEENEDFPYDSSSRLSTTDNESANNDYFDDSNPVDKYGAESLQENPDQLLEPLPKKRKTNDFSSVSISVANSSTERPALNSNSVGSTSASMHKQNTDMKNISNADEKWWQAQYGFYLKLNRKQQFKMKKMISDLQLEFEYENLEDAEQEPIANRSEQNVRTNTGADDPLEVNTPWW